MEVASISLSIIPLVVNQLDNYVQGLQTIRLLGGVRYREYLEWCSRRLCAHHAVLMNSMALALGDTYTAEFRNLISRSSDNVLEHPMVDDILRFRIGHSYRPFAAMLNQALKLLDKLSNKLKLEVSDPSTVSWERSITVLREIQKVKHIFSKSVSEELFDKLDKANKILMDLVHQSINLESHRGVRPSPSVSRLRRGRKLAKSSHSALIRGKGWECVCQGAHHIYFPINPKLQPSDDTLLNLTIVTKFSDGSKLKTYSLDLETQTPIPTGQNRKIDVLAVKPISSLCASLQELESKANKQEIAGYLSAAHYNHYMHIVKKPSESLQSQSLKEMILSTPIFPYIGSTGDNRAFCLKNRVRFAANFACVFIQFHGNWLPTNWTNQDILFPDRSAALREWKNPFLVWGISNDLSETISDTHLLNVQSKPLIPLALVLTELSLGHIVEDLRRPEDEHSDKSKETLNIISRCLNDVYYKCGKKYGDVVERCMSWAQTGETNLEDEFFQTAFLQYIAAPLLDVMGLVFNDV